MDAGRIQRALSENGIVVLAVTADHIEPGRFVVYLHGAAGSDHADRAIHVLRRLPWVAEVCRSAQTSAILLVRRRPGSCG